MELPARSAADDSLQRTELVFLLGLSFQLMLGEFVQRLNSAGYADLRPVHGMMFQTLRESGATASELADRLGITKQAAGQMIDDLERRGYVERTVHPQGGRRKLVRLTPQARDHLDAAGKILHSLESELARDLDPDGVANLRRELVVLIERLSRSEVPPLRPVW